MVDKLKVSSIKTLGFGLAYKSVMKDRRLTIQAKAIYCYISSYAGNGDTAFPGRDIICHDLDINKDTYYKHFKYLLAYGYITVEQDRSNNGFGNNIYTLNEFPEQHMDEELIKQIEEEKKNKKNKKNDNVTPVSENFGYSQNTQCPKNSDTANSDTELSDSNINSFNNNLYYSISISEIWQLAQNYISEYLQPVSYQTWIEPLQLIECKNNNIFVLRAPDEMTKEIVNARYRSEIEVALNKSCKANVPNADEVHIELIV